MSSGLGAEMHAEDPGNPNFTPEGLEAAKSSDMDVWSMRGVSSAADGWGSPTWSIDGWMSLPFHRMPILNPRLTSAGFGLYCESEACAAGLNLLKGSQGKMPAGAEASLPIEFPPDGGTVAHKIVRERMAQSTHELPRLRAAERTGYYTSARQLDGYASQ